MFSGEYCTRLSAELPSNDALVIPPQAVPSTSALFQAIASTAIPGPSAPLIPLASQAAPKRRSVSVKRGTSVARSQSQVPIASSSILTPNVWIGYFDLENWGRPDFRHFTSLTLASKEAIEEFEYLGTHEQPLSGWKEADVDVMMLLYDLVQYHWCIGLGMGFINCFLLCRTIFLTPSKILLGGWHLTGMTPKSVSR
jgi:hypothetical protein